jgi:hypothetical protein
MQLPVVGSHASSLQTPGCVLGQFTVPPVDVQVPLWQVSTVQQLPSVQLQSVPSVFAGNEQLPSTVLQMSSVQGLLSLQRGAHGSFAPPPGGLHIWFWQKPVWQMLFGLMHGRWSVTPVHSPP